LFSFLLPQAAAQLITNPQGFPHTGNPPVIFLNGYETNCSIASFQHSFANADQILQANGRSSYFFNTCSVPNRPSIEKIATVFGTLLNTLTYNDGQPVTTVDVVGYSLGGLVVRSYLSGKQEAQGTFSPPATTPIRKAIFIATPNFGTPIPLLFIVSIETQLDELSSGSHFLMDLNTWNQNHDDLRGIDAIAIAGTGGTGQVDSMAGFDDGLVPLTSSSLRFYQPGRTRILPLCHQADGSILTQAYLCPSGSMGISRMLSAGDDNARILVSFLTGTNDWQSIGGSPEQNAYLANGGGVLVRARNAADARIDPASIVATPSNGASKPLNNSNSEIFYTDYIAAGDVTLTVNAGSSSFTRKVSLPAGGYEPYVVKPDPSVALIAPSAAAIFPLVLAPRMIVSIYGSGLAKDQIAASAQPLPTSLSDVTVTVNGNAIPLLYVSPTQINALLPDGITGLNKLLVRNGAGSQTMNIYVEAAVPAVFSLDASGQGSAAALNATNGQIVSSTNPLHANEYMELFLTGLGTTKSQNGLNVAVQQPTVTVGGVDCPVTYAGAAPGFPGLDQINCRIPSGIGGQQNAKVTVTSGNRSSQVTTVAVR
jgi:uncharacterized protein (TIGR03437 family)